MSEFLETAALRFEELVVELTDELVGIPDTDSLEGWLQIFIMNSREAVRGFGLPASEASRNALTTLLGADAEFSGVLGALLAERLNVYLGVLEVAARHTASSVAIRSANQSAEQVRRFIGAERRHKPERTIPAVAAALRDGSLTAYRDEAANSDLWVVMKTLQENEQMWNSAEAPALIGFVERAVEEDLRSPGAIEERRHAWFAAQILADSASIHDRSQDLLAQWIDNLLQRKPYVADLNVVRKSITPELKSSSHEQLWETINVARVLGAPHRNLPEETEAALEQRRDDNQDWLVKRFSSDNFRELCGAVLATYDLALLEIRSDREPIELSSPYNLDVHRFGDTIVGERLAGDLNLLVGRVTSLAAKPARWSSPSMTSGLLCASPGQGKSHVLAEIERQLTGALDALGIAHVEHDLVLNQDIRDADDIDQLLASLRPDVIDIVIVDEIDKADFNIFGQLLGPLEPSSSDSRQLRQVIWLFAQSRFPTASSFGRFADEQARRGDGSMRDFYDRMRLGVIEVAPISLSPLRRFLTALSVAHAMLGRIVRVDSAWACYFARAIELSNARSMVPEVEQVSELIDGDLSLRTDIARPGSVWAFERCSQIAGRWIQLTGFDSSMALGGEIDVHGS